VSGALEGTGKVGGAAAAAGLFAAAALHAAWGAGFAWPFRDRAALADAVVGTVDVPGPVAAAQAKTAGR
jgi:hypothetical protein